LASVGCGGSQPAQKPQAGAASPDSTAAATAEGQQPGADAQAEPTAAERLKNLDLEAATAIVAEIERYWPLDENDPLANPQSLEDVEAILKRDQVNLFARALAFTAADSSFDATVLSGQIELAWGENYMLLMEILLRVRDNFGTAADKLDAQAASAPLSTTDADRLAWLRGSADELALRIEALKLVSIDHIASGFAKAEEVIEQAPDNYLGYRLEADYYRILRDWENFNAMVAKIKETNKDSNGLLFLLGAAAFQTEHDRAKAEKYYREALAKDPAFVRAQAHLLIIQDQIDRTYAELVALEKLNPNHQFVAIAGDSIKQAYAHWKEGQTKVSSRQASEPNGPGEPNS
jgi:tetratricopeptide (TPR) repeat protein